MAIEFGELQFADSPGQKPALYKDNTIANGSIIVN
jgi:hypothetical protein